MNSVRVHCVARILATLVFFSSSTDLRACACCSDDGDYSLTTGDPISEYDLGLIQGLALARAANLYRTDAGDEEDAKGMSDVSESYHVSAAIDAQEWRLTFRTKDGKTGVLTLPLPSTMTAYAADIHDGRKSAGHGPLLFKEWRLEGAAKGDGIFREGFAAPARYTLVFQGRGNRCDNAQDFTGWRLSVTGDTAKFAFFGKLVPAAE